MRYDYRCPDCHAPTERDTLWADRDTQYCRCGARLTRLPHYASTIIGIPAGFGTMFSDVHGMPGSPQRKEFEEQVRSGEIVYQGPGSRWV